MKKPTTTPSAPASALPSEPGPAKRIGLMAGVQSRDYGLMRGANASPRRNADGSQGDAGPGDDGGAYASPDGGQPAFQAGDAAFGAPDAS